MKTSATLTLPFFIWTLSEFVFAQSLSLPATPTLEMLEDAPGIEQPGNSNTGTSDLEPLDSDSSISAKTGCRIDRIASLLNSPDRIGYGADTNGGGEATEITWVTNLNDSGEGSLRDALGKPAPKWIAFDDSLKNGTILVQTQLPTSGDMTIDGRGSNGPLNITIAPTSDVNHMLVFWEGNVIIHGVILDGQNTNATGLMARTGNNFWIDQVTAKNWVADDAISIGRIGSSNTADNITISNYHARDTSKAILFYGEETSPRRGKLTLFRSILAATERNPKISYQKHAHIFNNYVHSYLYTGIQAHRGAEIYAENNLVSATTAFKKWRAIAGVDWEVDSNGTTYSVGNIVENGDEFNVIASSFDIEYDYPLLPTEEVVQYVTENAGAENANLTLDICN